MSEWPTWATERVQVQPPDEGWQRRGAQLCRELDAMLARWVAAPTQHVGSTAVPGLAAKPIIDVQSAVVDLGCADAVAQVLPPVVWHLVPADLDATAWRRGRRTRPPSAVSARSKPIRELTTAAKILSLG